MDIDAIVEAVLKVLREQFQINEAGKKAEAYMDTEHEKPVNLTGKHLLRESDLARFGRNKRTEILLDEHCIITPLAKDYISDHSIHIIYCKAKNNI